MVIFIYLESKLLALTKEELKEQLIGLLKSDDSKLISTHRKLCFPIIERLYKKMCIDISFNGIQVAEDSTIIDGHHRYLASLLANFSLERIPYPKTSAKEQTQWELVELVDDDWDTQAKIDMFNEQDAESSGMTTEALVNLLK